MDTTPKLDGVDGQEFHPSDQLVGEIEAARRRLAGVVVETPMIQSKSSPGALLKAESLQLTGSFKVRAAYNQLAALSEEARLSGVVTSSSGNFAQAAAWAAARLGTSIKIVMMRSSNPLKVERTRRWGGEVVFCDDHFEARAEMVEEIARCEGRLEIHPFDHVRAVAGNATLADEIIGVGEGVQRVLVPVSGGGLLAGVLAGLWAVGAALEVWGVQPEGSNAMAVSFEERRAVSITRADTICDGIAASRPGEHTLPIILKRAQGILTLTDEATLGATRACIEEERLVVEPSGALSLAAVREGLVPAEGTVCILSGGNINPRLMKDLLA